MAYYSTASAAIAGYHTALALGVSETLKTLLESKHLYQSVSVDTDAIRNTFLPKVEKSIQEHGLRAAHYSLSAAVIPWISALDSERLTPFLRPGDTRAKVIFTPPDLKLYCSRACSRVEAFNPVSAIVIGEDGKSERFQPIEELHALTYRCQSCKSTVDAFLVRRQSAKMQLAGRAPMEHVDVPAIVPKEIAKYYSGAVIAFQSGQALAANFMLRTACEQWARRWAEAADRADAAMDKYMAALPEAFRAQFPSLKDIYSQLSADIHAASGSEELYGKAMAMMLEHFDARRLYRLSLPTLEEKPLVPGSETR